MVPHQVIAFCRKIKKSESSIAIHCQCHLYAGGKRVIAKDSRRGGVLRLLCDSDICDSPTVTHQWGAPDFSERKINNQFDREH